MLQIGSGNRAWGRANPLVGHGHVEWDDLWRHALVYGINSWTRVRAKTP